MLHTGKVAIIRASEDFPSESLTYSCMDRLSGLHDLCNLTMKRKGAQSSAVQTTLAAIQAQNELHRKADDNALIGRSRLFTFQLWKAAGLHPKLMGERRVKFLQEEEENQLMQHGVLLVPNTTREARAMNRASRQRYSSMQDETLSQLNPKCWKEAAMHQYEKSTSNNDKLDTDDSDRLTGKRTSRSPSVEHDMPPAKKPTCSETSDKPLSSAERVSLDCDAPAVTLECESCSLCKEKVGPKGCGKPLVNCRECGQIMHFDCYVELSGAEPGPWDAILCEEHRPAKRARQRGNSEDLSQKSCSVQSSRGSDIIKASHSPRAVSSGLERKFLDQQQDSQNKDGVCSPVHSPAGSNSSSDATHHSFSMSEDRNGQLTDTNKDGALRSLAMSEPNDEELAMRLHRELNAYTRRRR